MKRLKYITFLALSGQMFAQVVIKNHHLGETPLEFKRDEAVQKKMADCHVDEPRRLTPDEVKKLSSTELFMISPVTSGMPDRKLMMKMAAEGKLFSKDKRAPATAITCQEIFDVLENGKDGRLSINYNQNVWGFRGGVLVTMYARFSNSDFDDIVLDFSKRAGFSPKIERPEMQNGFGAVWNNQVASWFNNEIYAVLTDDRNPSSQDGLSLMVMSKSFADKMIADKAKKASPLD